MRSHSTSLSSLRIAMSAAIVLLLVVAPALAVAQNGDPLERAIAVQERMTPQLMARAEVVGTGVGMNHAGVPVIRVFTVSGQVAGIPRTANGFAVQTVVTGLITASACQDSGNPAERCNRPVPIGVSVGHPNVTAGTIGARVKKGTSVYVLSNNHVLANSNNASVGDSALQPGSYDGGRDPADRIGTLAQWKVINFNYTSCAAPYSPTNPACNTIDAAIAQTTTGETGVATLAGWAPSTTTQSAGVGLSVLKCGRTTGCTVGSVAEVNVVVDVCYKPRGMFFCASNGVARFVDQITVSPGSFSAGGDSGSLIVTNDANKKPTGLLFAGSSTRTIANRIHYVLNEFSVSIDNTSSSPPPPDETAPAPPTGLAASAGDSQVSLSWNANGESDLAGYNVYRSTSSSSGYSKVNSVLHTSTSYTDTGLSNGTTYYYVVTAVDTSTNESGNSSEVSATPSAPDEPPGTAPQDLIASIRIQGTTRADLSWSDGASSVDVYRAFNDGSFAVIATVNNNGAYTDNLGKRPASGTYRYMVCDAGSVTACSNEASVTP